MAMVYVLVSKLAFIYTNLDRLFIVDGIISLPIALMGFIVLPDVPEISNPWYLTKDVRLPYRRNQQTLNQYIGSQTLAEAHGARRPKDQRAVYKSQAEKDIYLLAHLLPHHRIHVSTQPT